MPATRYHVEVDTDQVELTADGYDLRHTQEFYHPYYELRPGPASRPIAAVHVACSGLRADDRPELAMLQYLASTQSRPEITADGRTVEVFARPVPDLRIRMDRPARRIEIQGDHPVHVELQLRTLLRDQLLGQLEKARGWVVFHAAAVCRDGVGVAFMGDRNAGKTTSLVALMSTGRWHFLSADRVKLRPADDGVAMRGMPARCNIHRIALENDPFLRPLARGRRYDAEDKCLVDVADLTGLAGVLQHAAAPLRVLVLPRLDPQRRGLRTRVVTDAFTIRDLVAAQLMEGTAVDKHRHWLHYLPDSSGTLGDRLDRVLGVLARSVTVVTVDSSYHDYVDAIRSGKLDPLRYVP
jgi:hypothetical protein